MTKRVFVGASAMDDASGLIDAMQPYVDRGMVKWATQSDRPQLDMWYAFNILGELPVEYRIMKADVVLLMVSTKFMNDCNALRIARQLFTHTLRTRSTQIFPVACTEFDAKRIRCDGSLQFPKDMPIDQFDSTQRAWEQVALETIEMIKLARAA